MSDPPIRRVAVFDVCDTLFSTNTTLGFLQLLSRTSGDVAMAAALRRWTSRRSPAFYAGALAYRLLGRDIARTALIRQLRGRSRNELEDAARTYVNDELAERMVGRVHDRLEQHRRHGDRIILASSSLDIIVARIAEKLEVEFVASTLGFSEAICTGRLVRDLTGRKREAVRDLVAGGTSLHVYTDNQSDKDLLEIADVRTIILPTGSGGAHWAGEECEYLAV